MPEACSSWFLPRVVGLPKALEWSYSAEILAPQEALEGRLLSQVVAPEVLLEEACKIARKFTSGPSPVAVALTRQMMYRNAAADHPMQAHKVESLAVFQISQADGKEGVAAFLEKRSPRFRSKASEMPEFYTWWTE